MKRVWNLSIMLSQLSCIYDWEIIYDFIIVVVAVEQPTSVAPTQGNGTAGWELALVTAPSSNENATAASKLVLIFPRYS